MRALHACAVVGAGLAGDVHLVGVMVVTAAAGEIAARPTVGGHGLLDCLVQPLLGQVEAHAVRHAPGHQAE